MSQRKRLVALLLFSALCLGFASLAFGYSQAFNPPQTYVVISGVNYRTGPGKNYPKYGALSRGQVVTVTGIIDGWLELPLENGGYAYAWHEYLQPAGGGYSSSPPPPKQATRNQVCFYEHINYGGAAACWEVGKHAGDMTQVFFDGIYWNDQVSSVRIEGNARATVYEHINYGGASLNVVNDVPDMRYVRLTDGRTVNWNDVISSLKVYR